MTKYLDKDIFPIIELAFLRILIGEINPSLRGIAFDWDSDKTFVFIYFFHDGEITDAIEDHYSCLEAEATVHFYYKDCFFSHDFKVVRIDYPEQLPENHHWIYRRLEPFVDPS